MDTQKLIEKEQLQLKVYLCKFSLLFLMRLIWWVKKRLEKPFVLHLLRLICSNINEYK